MSAIGIARAGGWATWSVGRRRFLDRVDRIGVRPFSRLLLHDPRLWWLSAGFALQTTDDGT